MLTAGDIYAAGNDKPETFDVIRYTGSAEYSLAVANTRLRAVAEQEHRHRCHHRSVPEGVSELQASPRWPVSTPPT